MMQTENQHDLTAAQNDYAVFLPAVSSFYSTYVGRQRYEQYVEATRMPAGIPDMEMMNFLNDQAGLFPYRWALYSAGHANLDLTKADPREDMMRNRGNHTTLLCDSGGFQIAKGVWEGDWKDPKCPRAQKKREAARKWLDGMADYGMTWIFPRGPPMYLEPLKRLALETTTTLFEPRITTMNTLSNTDAVLPKVVPNS